MVLISLFFSSPVIAQSPPLEISILAFGGKVQVQREGEQVWQTVSKSFALSSGDLIKTGYKSFLILRIGIINQIVVGSNTNLLFEIMPLESKGPGFYLIKTTIFDGGAFYAWKGETELQVFSNNTLTGAPTGKFITTFQKLSGVTTVFSFSEKIYVQNIVRKNLVEIHAGEFTDVNADQDPTDPAVISAQLTDHLRKFFGAKFIDKEISKNNIEVQEAQLQQAVPEQRVKTKAKYEEETRITPLFNLHKLRQKVQKLEAGSSQMYRPAHWYDDMTDGLYFGEIQGRMVNAKIDNSQESFPGFRARVGTKWNNFRLAANIPYESTPDGYSQGMQGIHGIMDKIYFINYKDTAKFVDIHLGKIDHLTWNRGLLVNNFSNELKSQIAQPLGFNFRWSPNFLLDLNLLIPDLSDFSFLGGNLTYDNGWSILSASVMYDSKQPEALTLGDNYFRAEEEVLPLYPDKKSFSVLGTEFFAESNFWEHSVFNGFFYSGLSLLSADKEMNFTVQLPGINIIYRKFSFFLEGLITKGKTHRGYFSEFYAEDRTRIKKSLTDSIPQVLIDSLHRAGNDNEGDRYLFSISNHDRHPPMGISRGFRTGFDWQIMNNLWISGTYGQNLKSTFNLDSAEQASVDSIWIETNPNREITGRIFGGRGLISGLKRLECFYSVYEGGFGRRIRDMADTSSMYPMISNFESKNPNFSLNTSMGVLVEYSLIRNSSVIVQYRSYALDLDGNGIYDNGELLTEYSATVRYKF